MKKVYASATEALHGVLHDGMLIAAGGFGLCGIPENLIAAIRDSGVQEPDRGVQQRRRRRLRAWAAAADPAGQEDDQFLRRRKRRIHAPVPVRRTGAGVQPARHAGRTDARRWRWHPGLLHQDRRRHGDRRGQGTQGFRRRDLHSGTRPRRRPVHRQGLEGRRHRQPGVPQDRAQLQPAGGDPAAGSAWPRSRKSCRAARSTPT